MHLFVGLVIDTTNLIAACALFLWARGLKHS
jgi:hypothetical protein